MVEKRELKQLSFVEKYAKLSADRATRLYASAKVNILPAFAKVRLEKAEAVASQYTAPTYNQLLATSHSLLKFADTKVDTAVVSSKQIYYGTIQDFKNIAEPDVLKKHMYSARDTAYSQSNKAVDFVRQSGLVGTTQYLLRESIYTVQRVLDSGAARSRSLTNSFLAAAQDSASFLQGQANTFADVATKKSRAAHDAVVKQPLYKNAYERTNHFVHAATDTQVYKATINHIYPLVAPVYNPAYEKIEPYYTSTVNYWKPVTAAA